MLTLLLTTQDFSQRRYRQQKRGVIDRDDDQQCDAIVIGASRAAIFLSFALAVIALSVACGGDDNDEFDIGDGQTKIGQALEAAEGSEVMVSGFLIADRDGSTRLCSALLESFPPQCGGDRIELLGFDASAVPNTSSPQRQSEIRTVRWTKTEITVTGIKGIAGLAEVRLSTEN